jgi:hypothetical protein
MFEVIQGETFKDPNDMTADDFAHKAGPKPMTPEELAKSEAKREADGELNRMFAAIKKKVAEGYVFTDAQMDIAMTTMFSKLEPADVGWIKELSSTVVSRPIWQLFAGWFKLLQERGEVTAAIFDPTWEQVADNRKEKSICDQCNIEFEAERFGQKFCSTVCGAAHEKAHRGQ